MDQIQSAIRENAKAIAEVKARVAGNADIPIGYDYRLCRRPICFQYGLSDVQRFHPGATRTVTNAH